MAEHKNSTRQDAPPSDNGGKPAVLYNPAPDTMLHDYEAAAQTFEDLEPLAKKLKLPEKHKDQHVPLGEEDIENEDSLVYGTIHRGNFLTDEELLADLPTGETLKQPEAFEVSTDQVFAATASHQVADFQGPDGTDPLARQTEDGRYELVSRTERSLAEGESPTGALSRNPDQPEDGDIDDQSAGDTSADIFVSTQDTDAIDGNHGDDDEPLSNDLNANSNDDILRGGDGGDTLDGGPGDDTFYGDDGDDVMLGGDGNDVFYGGPGDDTASGDAGNDLFIFGHGNGTDHFSGGSGWADVIQLDGITVGPDEGVWTLDVGGGTNWAETDSGLEFDESASGSIELGDGSTLTFEDIDRIDWSSG